MLDDASSTWYRRSGDGFTIDVHAVPGARRSEVAGTHGDALRIRLAAPPVDGKANEELARLLARLLGVARASVTVEAGLRGRRKRVHVTGVGELTLESLARGQVRNAGT